MQIDAEFKRNARKQRRRLPSASRGDWKCHAHPGKNRCRKLGPSKVIDLTCRSTGQKKSSIVASLCKRLSAGLKGIVRHSEFGTSQRRPFWLEIDVPRDSVDLRDNGSQDEPEPCAEKTTFRKKRHLSGSKARPIGGFGSSANELLAICGASERSKAEPPKAKSFAASETAPATRCRRLPTRCPRKRTFGTWSITCAACGPSRHAQN